jgi:hypothetical protein
MKWLWLGFGLAWGLSLWLDARRRRRTTRRDGGMPGEPVDHVESDLPEPAREAA